MRQSDGGFDGFVEDLHLVMFFERGDDAAHHQDGLCLVRFFDFDDLKAAGQGGIFFDMLFVFVPGRGGDGAQRAASQSGFEQIGGIAGAGSATCADQRVRFVNEENDRLGRLLDFVDDLPKALFEFAFHAGAGLQQADVQRAQAHVFQSGRDIAGDDAQGEAFDDGGFADAGFAGQDGIVLAAAHEDVDDLADFFVAADDRIDFTFAGFFGEIHGELCERFLLAHRGGRHGTAGFARSRAGAQAGAVAGAKTVPRASRR